MVSRLANRLMAFVVGVALVAGGALVVLEGIWTWTNSGFVWIPGDSWLHSFETTPWSEPRVIAISTGVGIIGLLLLAVELKPRRPRTLPYETAGPGEWQVGRRSAEAHVSRRLAPEAPTSPIKARLRPGRRTWSLHVKARAAASSVPSLEQAGRAQLEELHAPAESRVRVKATGAPKT